LVSTVKSHKTSQPNINSKIKISANVAEEFKISAKIAEELNQSNKNSDTKKEGTQHTWAR
jgi:hypothetical protein